MDNYVFTEKKKSDRQSIPFRFRVIQTLLFLPAIFFFTVGILTVRNDYRYVEMQKKRAVLRTFESEGWIIETHQARARSGTLYPVGILSYITAQHDTVSMYLGSIRSDWKVGDRFPIWVDPTDWKNYSFRNGSFTLWEQSKFSIITLFGIASLMLIGALIQRKKLMEEEVF